MADAGLDPLAVYGAALASVLGIREPVGWWQGRRLYVEVVYLTMSSPAPSGGGGQTDEALDVAAYVVNRSEFPIYFEHLTVHLPRGQTGMLAHSAFGEDEDFGRIEPRDGRFGSKTMDGRALGMDDPIELRLLLRSGETLTVTTSRARLPLGHRRMVRASDDASSRSTGAGRR